MNTKKTVKNLGFEIIKTATKILTTIKLPHIHNENNNGLPLL